MWYGMEGWLQGAVTYQYVQAWEKTVAKLWTGVATEYDFQQTDYMSLQLTSPSNVIYAPGHM